MLLEADRRPLHADDAGSTTVPCEGPLGGSGNKTTDNRAHSLPAASRHALFFCLLMAVRTAGETAKCPRLRGVLPR